MEALQKNIAVARGEAVAAHLLASAALQTMFMMVTPTHREQVLAQISAFIDNTLNMSRPAKGSPDDEFNTLLRETARLKAMECLHLIEDMIRNAPTKG